MKNLSSPFLVNWAYLIVLFLSSCNSLAGEADVTDVSYECNITCAFSVTVKHADEGWDHFANRWEVVTVSGDIIATRVLAHPHQKNKPFTRSLSNIKLPENTETVIVRAHDLVHGFGGKEITIKIESKTN